LFVARLETVRVWVVALKFMGILVPLFRARVTNEELSSRVGLAMAYKVVADLGILVVGTVIITFGLDTLKITLIKWVAVVALASSVASCFSLRWQRTYRTRKTIKPTNKSSIIIHSHQGT